MKKVWINKKGDEVHPDNVKASDKIKDEMVEDIIKKALEEQKKMKSFKENALRDIDDYISLMRDEYKLDATNSKKGNMSFETFDGLKKVTISVQDTLEFDEKLIFAKEKMDAFLKEETKDSSATIKTLIMKAFDVDKKGSVNVKNIISLKNYDIEHPLWKEAMEIIDDSIQIATSKSYIRFYTKKALGEAWELIALDPSKL